MLDEIVSKAPLFLLVSARCAALLFTLPLFSMRTVPKAAKIALAGYMAFFLMGSADGIYGHIYKMYVFGKNLLVNIVSFSRINDDRISLQKSVMHEPLVKITPVVSTND